MAAGKPEFGDFAGTKRWAGEVFEIQNGTELRMNAATGQLEQTFKLSVYGLAMFSGLILGLAVGAWLPYGTLFLAVIGYRFAESPGRYYLGTGLSNLAGFVAISCAAWEFFSDNPEGRLLSGTHLVVYATWIVFLQKSSLRKYWSICALSVLQVAVAAVLTNQSWYGGTLVLFALCSIWTLSVFSLYQAVEQHREMRLNPGAPAAAWGATDGGMPRFHDAVSEVGHAIQMDDIGRWITFRFVSGVILLSAAALLMSAVFYVMTPRVWIGRRISFSDSSNEPELRRRNLTGFTRQVKLGEMGQILESTEPVMTIEAYDVSRGEDRKLSLREFAATQGFEEPLFRGGVLTAYRGGDWDGDSSSYEADRYELPKNPGRADLRQEIELEPVAGATLFCFGNPLACEIGTGRQLANLNWLTGVLARRRSYQTPRRTISYRLFMDHATAAADGLPRLSVRSSVEPRGGMKHRLMLYLDSCRTLEDEKLLRLKELAQSLAAEVEAQQGRRPTTVELVRTLESHLRDSGKYSYSVNLSIQDASIDPVEDFLFNRKTGHCEYFATALALMLRAVDIPSRLVNGFKGGDENFRGQIEIQQRHAHAWVEAFDEEGGSWLVLDPTPAAARAESVAEVVGGMSTIERLLTAVSSIWSDWVMNFTPERQYEDLYTPLQELGQKLWAQGENAAASGPAYFTALWHFFLNPRELLSARGLLTLGVLTLTVIGTVSAARRLRRWWRWRVRGGPNDGGRQRMLVPFYERYLELMSARGLARGRTQTPAEFAVEVAAKLNGQLSRSAQDKLPQTLTELFYQVRYGELQLNEVQQCTVHDALRLLEQSGRSRRDSVV